jgi:hypothetical protein
MERLINTKLKEIDFTYNYVQSNKMKPVGLWYSINYEWLEWCRDNFRIHKEILEIDLSNVLVIDSVSKLKSLIREFGYFIVEGVKYIDWRKLSKRYSGIEFVNYNEIRNQLSILDLPTWFYGLDVSSGCIWDLSVIKNYKHRELDLSLWVDDSEH